MAIKPQTLAELKHGKFICRAVYPTFVATWNWIVRFTSTIKGDFDVNPKTGVVTVDRTDPDHPVIRLRQDKLLKGNKVYKGPFNPVVDDDGIVTGFEYCYFQVGGKTLHLDDIESFSGVDCIVCLKVPTTTDGELADATVVTYSTYADLAAAQNDISFEVVPLFVIDSNRHIVVDLRSIPTFQMEEII